jgi:hypothetical protein
MIEIEGVDRLFEMDTSRKEAVELRMYCIQNNVSIILP